MTDICNVNAVTPEFISQLNENFSAIDAELDALLNPVRDVAHGGTGVTGFGIVSTKTVSGTLIAAQSYQTFTNEGASGAVTLTLPTPIAGLEFGFVVVVAQSLVIDVGGSVVIALGEITSSAGGNVSSSSPYSALTLKAVSSTLWVSASQIGSWAPA
ncbi:hypothetical protein [Reyranella sp.]|uniref:hypothetical protein n=1 Tax=Reyranella sp. TaxID=1929291 RepID=UPI00121AAD25|nr:hypothetical protein [Reyranella sp.]TAJ91005.1 MAG: hypothetical protein EPO50_00300 [Reyranella sp.]